MKILITSGSKHGSTDEIARAMGEVFTKHGIDATVAEIQDDPSVEEFDAVVIGSAVYGGRWLKEAKAFVERNAGALTNRPVWLFSSGPVGEPLKPEEEPVDVPALLELTGARDHHIFAGRLERSTLGFSERALVMAVRAPYGDFRDWNEIWNWTSAIADVLRPVPATT